MQQSSILMRFLLLHGVPAAGYMSYIMLSTQAPGLPAYQVSPDTLLEVYHESLNFFYINIGLDALNLAPVPSIAEHPVSEALFNFVNAWGMMFLPILLTEKRSQKVPKKILQWTGIMFLTNVFFIPFLAQRAVLEAHPSGLTPQQRTAASLSSTASATLVPSEASTKALEEADSISASVPKWQGIIGGLGLFIGAFSLGWCALARPEYGDIAARAAYFQNSVGSDRVFYAFVVDAGLYGFWQALLMSAAGAPRAYCAVPFFGLGAWLVAGAPKK